MTKAGYAHDTRNRQLPVEREVPGRGTMDAENNDPRRDPVRGFEKGSRLRGDDDRRYLMICTYGTFFIAHFPVWRS